jgi:hypothetical protein
MFAAIMRKAGMGIIAHPRRFLKLEEKVLLDEHFTVMALPLRSNDFGRL